MEIKDGEAIVACARGNLAMAGKPWRTRFLKGMSVSAPSEVFWRTLGICGIKNEILVRGVGLQPRSCWGFILAVETARELRDALQFAIETAEQDKEKSSGV